MGTDGTPREQLAETLKRARIKSGFKSQTALAKKMTLSRPVVSKAESAYQPVPSDDVLVSWSEATGYPLESLRAMARRCRTGSPEWFVPYEGAERTATRLRCWSPIVVPGLVQTPAYARALLATEHSGERLEELVSARLERQKVIGRAHLTVIIDARVLTSVVGNPKIMREQCSHLVTIASRQDVSLYVVPAGANHGTAGGFDVATSNGNAMVRMDALRDFTSTSVEMADLALGAFERLLGVAMSPDESLRHVRESEERWKNET